MTLFYTRGTPRQTGEPMHSSLMGIHFVAPGIYSLHIAVSGAQC